MDRAEGWLVVTTHHAGYGRSWFCSFERIGQMDIDIEDLPTAESDKFEFKSSRIVEKMDNLANELQIAVSGFANSGGGTFVIGVDKSGNVDGGIPMKVGKGGRQDLADWLDQKIRQVDPTPKYEIQLVEDAGTRGSVTEGNAVVMVHVPQSFTGPHMAPDGRYYIRAGRHTEPATHFLVEAIRARRTKTIPMLVHLARLIEFEYSDDELVIEIISLTDAPALNVSIHATGLERGSLRSFPLQVPVIDKEHSFVFRGTVPTPTLILIRISYSDISGEWHENAIKFFSIDAIDNTERAFGPLESIAKSLAFLASKK
jgi:hypothetical protein